MKDMSNTEVDIKVDVPIDTEADIQENMTLSMALVGTGNSSRYWNSKRSWGDQYWIAQVKKYSEYYQKYSVSENTIDGGNRFGQPGG